jgi:hypothetical protein
VSLPDVALIRARYEKQLILRLSHVCETIIAEAPEIAHRTNFIQSWENARTLTSQGLVLASRQPLLDAWVSSAEWLVRYGLHLRYPDAHPARHLKQFARIVLSWAPNLPDKTSGHIAVAGPQVLPLFHGSMLLIGTDRTLNGTISWAVDGGTLRVFGDGEECLLIANLSDSHALTPNTSWQIITPAKVACTLLDTWTPDYHRHYPSAPEAASLEEQLSDSLAQLSLEASAMMESLCATATQMPERTSSQADDARSRPWIAGLIRVPVIGCSARDIVDAACRDCVERMLVVNPLGHALDAASPGSDFRSLLVEVAAERLASRLVPDAPETRRDRESYWPKILARLRTSEEGRVFLEDIGEEATTLSTLAHGEGAASTAQPERPGFTFPPELAFRKTRKASAFSVDDFSTLKAVSEGNREDLERLLPALMAHAPQSEAQAFHAAAAAYSLGDFKACAKAVTWCLSFDADVEEYWHILAFALRYLGRRDDFNAIVFGGFRDAQHVMAP